MTEEQTKEKFKPKICEIIDVIPEDGLGNELDRALDSKILGEKLIEGPIEDLCSTNIDGLLIGYTGELSGTGYVLIATTQEAYNKALKIKEAHEKACADPVKQYEYDLQDIAES